MKRPSIASESRESTIDNHRSVYFAMITLPLRQRLETGKPLDFPSKRMRKGGGNENGADSDSFRPSSVQHSVIGPPVEMMQSAVSRLNSSVYLAAGFGMAYSPLGRR